MIDNHSTLFTGYSQRDSYELLFYLQENIHKALVLYGQGSNDERKAQEFEKEVLDKILSKQDFSNQEWNKARAMRGSSIISDIFYGQQITTRTCGNCYAWSHSFQDFSIWGVDVSEDLPIGSSSKPKLEDYLKQQQTPY